MAVVSFTLMKGYSLPCIHNAQSKWTIVRVDMECDSHFLSLTPSRYLFLFSSLSCRRMKVDTFSLHDGRDIFSAGLVMHSLTVISVSDSDVSCFPFTSLLIHSFTDSLWFFPLSLSLISHCHGGFSKMRSKVDTQLADTFKSHLSHYCMKLNFSFSTDRNWSFDRSISPAPLINNICTQKARKKAVCCCLFCSSLHSYNKWIEWSIGHRDDID